ncbi:MAG: hypothetical protein ACLFQV_02090 [Vulcanimicrobiota bacterium]
MKISPQKTDISSGQGRFGRIKAWLKDKISHVDSFSSNYVSTENQKMKTLSKIGGATAGAGASFLASTGKEIITNGIIAKDKSFHAGGCLGITMALGTLGLPPWMAATFTFAGVTAIKEGIYDGLLGRGCVEIRDVVANLSGSLAGYAALKTLDSIQNREKTAGHREHLYTQYPVGISNSSYSTGK